MKAQAHFRVPQGAAHIVARNEHTRTIVDGGLGVKVEGRIIGTTLATVVATSVVVLRVGHIVARGLICAPRQTQPIFIDKCVWLEASNFNVKYPDPTGLMQSPSLLQYREHQRGFRELNDGIFWTGIPNAHPTTNLLAAVHNQGVNRDGWQTQKSCGIVAVRGGIHRHLRLDVPVERIHGASVVVVIHGPAGSEGPTVVVLKVNKPPFRRSVPLRRAGVWTNRNGTCFR